MLYLQNDLKQYFKGTAPLFDQVMALSGVQYRHQEGRLTQCVRLGDKTYFIKQHHGIGWGEIAKNFLQLRWPILGAKNEWQALEKLRLLNIAAPKVVGYGERRLNPARKESFVLMENIHPATSLEDLTAQWKIKPPTLKDKHKLIDEVARIMRTLHQAGMNHRDCYLCHFLLHPKGELYVIDLHRAGIRSRTPTRWLIKDLAGLYFSSRGIGLTKRDELRFIKAYRTLPLRVILKMERKFWHKVEARGKRLYDILR